MPYHGPIRARVISATNASHILLYVNDFIVTILLTKECDISKVTKLSEIQTATLEVKIEKEVGV